MRTKVKSLVAAGLLGGCLGTAWATGTAGTVDSTFGGTGIVVESDSRVLATLVRPADGTIVATGYRQETVGGIRYVPWVIRRSHADGTDDATFGSGGTQVLFPTARWGGGSACALDAAGRLYVGGTTTLYTTGKGGKVSYHGVASVVRLTEDGSLDTTFGQAGWAYVDDANASISALAVQPDGKVVVAGRTLPGKTASLWLARFGSGGSLDATFGSGGVVKYALNNAKVNGYVYTFDEGIAPHGIGLQSTGKILVAAWMEIDMRNFNKWRLLRFNANGTFDSTFGPVSEPTWDLKAIAVDANDRIVAAGSPRYVVTNPDGSATIYAQGDALVTRYTQNGAVDTTFATDGEVLTSIGTAFTPANGGLVFDSQARIVMAGRVPADPNASAIRVHRFLADGSLDGFYGTGGVSDTLSSPTSPGPGGTQTGIFCLDAAVTPTDDLVIVGTGGGPGYGNWQMGRIWGN